MSLAPALEDFLRGTKTSERLVNDELRATITVETGLERIAAERLRDGRDVVIAGSAGGGKTQFIHRVGAILAGLPQPIACRPWDDPIWQDASAGPAVKVVGDLTATPATSRAAALARGPGVAGVLVGANEGTIGSVGGPTLGPVLDMLHLMQQGIDPDVADAPVIIDLAGFNPFSSTADGPSAFERILALDILAEVVTGQCADARVCPRAQAWGLLRSPDVRSRLSSLFERAVGPAEIRFREIWEFIEDLALGGSCDDDPPTSPWFWRVFYGDSRMARRLRSVASPDVLAIPGDEVRLYYGDWFAVTSKPAGETDFRWLASAPAEASSEQRRRMMNWLKCQVALASADGATVPRFLSDTERRIDDAIAQGSPDQIIESLNRYQLYNLASRVRKNALELWVELSVERRQRRPPGAFSLGAVPSSRLEVRRSMIIGNAGVEVDGSRAFLVGPGEASLQLEERLLKVLGRGRSVRTADRRDDDLDWSIWRFYARLSSQLETTDPTTLSVVRFEDGFGAAHIREWSIQPNTARIEAGSS